MATERKTKTYTIKNKHGTRVSIPLPTCYANTLDEKLPNTTEWIQTTYSEQEEQFPLLDERALKKEVRSVVFKKATENLTREELM